LLLLRINASSGQPQILPFLIKLNKTFISVHSERYKVVSFNNLYSLESNDKEMKVDKE
jgi:hypothetical protein